MSFFSFTTMAHVEYTISVCKLTQRKIREKKRSRSKCANILVTHMYRSTFTLQCYQKCRIFIAIIYSMTWFKIAFAAQFYMRAHNNFLTLFWWLFIEKCSETWIFEHLTSFIFSLSLVYFFLICCLIFTIVNILMELLLFLSASQANSCVVISVCFYTNFNFFSLEYLYYICICMHLCIVSNS